jgi:hypothetical protein
MTSIRAKSSPEENKFVFDNLVLLRKGLQDMPASKRDFDSILSDSLGTAEIIDENLSPRKKGGLSKQLFLETSNCPRATGNSARIPFHPVDMNALPICVSQRINEYDSKTSGSTGRQTTKQQRTMRAKEEKRKQKESRGTT